MSSVETGQMSAVETGQMTAAETSVLSQQRTSVLFRQQTIVVFSTQPNRLVPTEDISSVGKGEVCPVPAIHIVDASDKGSGPKSQKWLEMGPEWSPGPENRAI